MSRILILFILFFSHNLSFAQLGFCEGSKGDPIVHQDFGTGSGTGPALPAGTTNYRYVRQDPAPGEYTVADNISRRNSTWHSFLPDDNLSGGRALVVDAGQTAGLFYETKISGLCEGTSYEFSAFVMNIYDAAEPVCANGGIPVNVRFEIWDESGSELLGRASTGDIESTFSPEWGHYALTFQSEGGQNAVILKMFNNGAGGCGNDLAIDDIVFRSCGDLTTITAGENEGEIQYCEPEAPVSVELTATPDFSVYEEHAFQWQESDDNQSWQDITGEKDKNYTTPAISASKYYRVKVAENEVNLDDNLCSSASEAFHVEIVETPVAPVNDGDVVVCGNEEIPALSVQVADDEEVDWYDAEVNGNLLAENTTTFHTSDEGIYYAAALKQNADCEAGPRTAVRLEINALPAVEDEILHYCPDVNVILDAGVDNMEYRWSTGETTGEIEVSSTGNYHVEIVTAAGCSITKNFEVLPIEVAEIKDIISEEESVTIVPVREGDFEYSLDGRDFQRDNVFESIAGGIYTAYMRDIYPCRMVTEEFPHIVVPNFITPNGDGYNDVFQVNGLEYFPAAEIKIFNRYGKLLKSGRHDFKWDGNFGATPLPADDYWYHVVVEGFKTFKGHFSLER